MADRKSHMASRKAQGIPAKQVAAEHGVHPSTVSRVLSPKPTMPMGDNRVGRLSDVKTDRGVFRMKANRKGD